VFARLFVLFVAVPLVELAVLIQIGAWLGVWPTVGLVLLTGLVGASLARSQGGRVLRAIRAEVAVGRVPAQHLLDGLLILIGGILLLTPGLLTDIAGTLLMLPPTRARLRAALRRRLEDMIRSGRLDVSVLRR
jgi:UPF0716 protein FxsA